MAKAKVATAKEIELNRWCIELAMRWPVVHMPPMYGNQAVGMQQVYGQALPARDVDADVIGRANKIMAWVKAAHA